MYACPLLARAAARPCRRARHGAFDRECDRLLGHERIERGAEASPTPAVSAMSASANTTMPPSFSRAFHFSSGETQ
jgi:hypothetical protein